MAKECPSCGLLNPPEALRCDCGYDFRVHRTVRCLGPTYAGFWPRAWAHLIDLLLWAPFIALLFTVYNRSSTTVWILSGFAFGMIGLAYPIYFHARWGQTVGKMVAKIKVTRLDGGPITLRHALLRNAVDVMLWVLYASSTIYVLAVWPEPEWVSISRADQRRLLVERNPLFGTYDIVQQIWMWSELLVLLFNTKRRALHDFIAGTVVVKTVSTPAAPIAHVGDETTA
jgi:uncharacterized RDD family membrane protein YckC